MPKVARAMTPAQIKALGPGFWSVGHVPGLSVRVMPEGDARSWILRTVVGTKRRDIGLGGLRDVSLAQAIELARDAKLKVRHDGVDPVEERRRARQALIESQVRAKSFDQCVAAYLKAHEAGWKNAKHRAQWEATLDTYASPVIGTMPVADIEMHHVLRILQPLWTEKTETATRVRQRIEAVLDWAKGHGYRSGDNPAAWKGNLDAQLPKPAKVAKKEHHKAVPVDEMPAFMAALRVVEGVSARALELVALTACRSGEVRGMTWDEVDLDAKVWVVPADRMKAGVEHRVPLSDAAIKIIESMPKRKDSPYVFAAVQGGQLSDMALTQVMRRMEIDAVPHGLRSTFRDWAGERTSHAHDVIEKALAHTIKNAVEAAYYRTDLLDKRRVLMDDWSKFCAKPASKAGAKVVPISKQRKARAA